MFGQPVQPSVYDLLVIAEPTGAGDRAIDSRWMVVALLVVATFSAALVWFFVARSDTDRSSVAPSTNGMSAIDVDTTTVAVGPLAQLTAAAFEDRMSDAAVTVINVHVPYEGELPGTDAFVAFDRIVDDPAIPADEDARILLYCQTGRMSMIAGEALVALGYRDVAHLDGGMVDWEASGRRIASDPANT